MEGNISKKIFKLLEDAKRIVNSSPDESYSMCREAYDISVYNSLLKEEGYSLLGIAFVYRSKSETANMLETLFKAQEIFDSTGDSMGLIRVYNLMGVAYFYSFMYDKALSYFLKAKDNLIQFKDDNLSLSVLNNIGEVYRESENHDQALNYYLEAISICDRSGNHNSKAIIHGNIGEIYFVKGNYDKALEYFTLSYNQLKNDNDNISLGEVENRIGRIHQTLGNDELATKYFNTAYDRLEKMDNKYFVIDVLINIGLLNIENTSSLKYFEKAFKYSELINAKKKSLESLLNLSGFYEVHGNFKEALEIYKRYCRLDKEIVATNLGKKLEILNVELRFLEETKQLERMKEVLEMEVKNQKSELERIKQINIELEKKAYEDDLTKIPNRRRISMHINNLLTDKSSDDNICVFIMDIDYFKRYNDYWGHSEGDNCLKSIADKIMRNKCYEEDLFGRYGGEEFIYVSTSMNREEAQIYGEKLREIIRELDLYYYFNNIRTNVTFSIGGIYGPLDYYKNLKGIIESADRELYAIKESGRDMVRIKFD